MNNIRKSIAIHPSFVITTVILALTSMTVTGRASASTHNSDATFYRTRDAAVELPRQAILERQQLEIILDEDLKRHHMKFMRSPRYALVSYTDYWISRYDSRLARGKVLARVVAPIVGSLTILGIVGLAVHARNDTDCTDEDYSSWFGCSEDFGEHFGMVFIGTIGGLGTIIPLAIGLSFILSAKNTLRRLNSLKNDKRYHPNRKTTPRFSTSGLSVGLEF